MSPHPLQSSSNVHHPWTYVLYSTTKIKKNIKNVTGSRDSRSTKAGKQGSGDSIKQFSTQLCPVHTFIVEICRVGLYAELFYAIIPTLFSCFMPMCYPYIS